MNFEAYLGFGGSTATIHLSGELTDRNVPVLRSIVDQAVQQPLSRLVLRVQELESIAPGGVRCLAFAQQHLPPGVEILVDGAREEIHQALELGGFDQAVTFIQEVPAVATESV
jgi:anti-anti-sigma factor